MNADFVLPADPMARYRELVAALHPHPRWYEGVPLHLRYAALTLATTEGDARAVAGEIHSIADRLKKRAGWFGALNSRIRFVVAAMLLRNWDGPDEFLDETERVQRLFREERLPRGGIYEIISILLMRQQGRGKPIRKEDVARFRQIYGEMKHYHWWLTSVTDYPACAILFSHGGRPEEISSRLERLYDLLRDGAGCGRGDATQLVSHILFMNPAPEEKAVRRFVDLRQAFRGSGAKITSGEWDELALLTFLAHPVDRIVRETLRARDAILEIKPPCWKHIAFNLGASIAFLKLVRLTEKAETVVNAKALSDLQGIIAAQQAAAACAAATAAMMASSSS